MMHVHIIHAHTQTTSFGDAFIPVLLRFARTISLALSLMCAYTLYCTIYNNIKDISSISRSIPPLPSRLSHLATADTTLPPLPPSASAIHPAPMTRLRAHPHQRTLNADCSSGAHFNPAHQCHVDFLWRGCFRPLPHFFWAYYGYLWTHRLHRRAQSCGYAAQRAARH